VLVLCFGSPAGAERSAAPSLGDSFAMVFTVTSQQNFGVPAGFRFGGLIWAFSPRCETGACPVEVSTAQGACVSGRCPQFPSGFIWSHEVLRPASGLYKGAFTVKSNCFQSSTGNIPYAYAQRTTVSLRVTATTRFGSIVKASRIKGTLTVAGSPNSFSRARGCRAYAGTFAFTGTRRG
jgi:hypothetical protein